MDGFLWTLDPAPHAGWLTEWIGTDSPCVPFARTAFADLLFVVDRRIVVLLSNKGLLSRLTDRGDRLFNRFLTDNTFLRKYFAIDLFREARSSYGLGPDECFGFTPLLSLGGSETVEHIAPVKLDEYLLLLSQASDELDFVEH